MRGLSCNTVAGFNQPVRPVSAPTTTATPAWMNGSALLREATTPATTTRTAASFTPPPPSAPTSVIQQNSTITHRVVSGDTLSALAIKHDTTIQAIAEANNLVGRENNIQIGQELRIPQQRHTLESLSNRINALNNENSENYANKAGEILRDIETARRNVPPEQQRSFDDLIRMTGEKITNKLHSPGLSADAKERLGRQLDNIIASQANHTQTILNNNPNLIQATRGTLQVAQSMAAAVTTMAAPATRTAAPTAILEGADTIATVTSTFSNTRAVTVANGASLVLGGLQVGLDTYAAYNEGTRGRELADVATRSATRAAGVAAGAKMGAIAGKGATVAVAAPTAGAGALAAPALVAAGALVGGWMGGTAVDVSYAVSDAIAGGKSAGEVLADAGLAFLRNLPGGEQAVAIITGSSR